MSDRLIFEAFIWSLHLNRDKCERPLRQLREDDFVVIRQLKAALQSSWFADKHTSEQGYKKWRDTKLDHWKKLHGWSLETRNLYSSMLSILGNWLHHGRSKRDDAALQKMMEGAELIFMLYPQYQPKLL